MGGVSIDISVPPPTVLPSKPNAHAQCFLGRVERTLRRFFISTTTCINIPPKDFLMAEKQSDNRHSSEERPVLVSCGSSSTELSTAATSGLQPFSLGRLSSSVSSPSNLSSYTVPVRLDVLYFLLNSAAKGAQNTLPSLPAYGGQGTFSTCPCPSAQYALSCSRGCHHSTCNGVTSCTSIPLPSGGAHHLGEPQGGCAGQGGFSAGVPGNQNSGQHCLSTTHQRDGKGWPGSSQPNSATAWRSNQTTVGWKGHQREEGADRNNRDNRQGRWPSYGRSWGDRRQGTTESNFRKPGFQSWGREGSPFGSNSDSSRKNQEGSRRKMPWDVPDVRRRSNDVRVGWQKNQAKLEPTNSHSKAIDTGPAKSMLQVGGEDWEMDYENKEASSAAQASVSHPAHQKSQGDTPKTSEDWENEYASSSNPPKLRPRTSPLLEAPAKDPGSNTTRKESSGSHADQSKNGGFVSYLKGLYSDLPGKSSSEGSTDLAIDTDMESSKPSEEEQSPKNTAAAEESKAWE
ncbi:hypothetical protein JD844_005710 [Phrynosoma platyrhinos]|uniref:Uncharacterized protein n=1 Tax=Phrynosoma platyrhinos TaxID=52577 RepID=A0ABQ7TPM5_PHRPL|nr:hypothetical protein JD844_005710 [Phrynosoma platyrhinos]